MKSNLLTVLFFLLAIHTRGQEETEIKVDTPMTVKIDKGQIHIGYSALLRVAKSEF